MDTSNIIIILLFIVPGILAEKISAFVDVTPEKKRSDSGMLLISGVASSFPILLISAIIIFYGSNYKTAAEYIWAIKYIVDPVDVIKVVSIVTLVWGVVSVYFYKLIVFILNKIKVKLLKHMEVDKYSCWSKFFADGNKSHYVEVILDGNRYKGFLGPFSVAGEEKEIILKNYSVLQSDNEYDRTCNQYEYEKKLKKVTKTYIDLEKNIVVNDYDMEEYDKWVDEKRKDNSSNKPVDEPIDKKVVSTV